MNSSREMVSRKIVKKVQGATEISLQKDGRYIDTTAAATAAHPIRPLAVDIFVSKVSLHLYSCQIQDSSQVQGVCIDIFPVGRLSFQI